MCEPGQLDESYPAVNAIWEAVPDEVRHRYDALVVEKLDRWCWDRLGFVDHYDLLMTHQQEEARSARWSKGACLNAAHYPYWIRGEENWRHYIHVMSHWLWRRLNGQRSVGEYEAHGAAHACLELELSRLAVEWLSQGTGRSGGDD